jgi:hypothetical protein
VRDRRCDKPLLDSPCSDPWCQRLRDKPLSSFDSRRHTQLAVLYTALGGSTDMLGRVRQGTCDKLTATPDIPVRLPGDEVDSGDPQGGTTVLPLQLSAFNTQRYVFELGAGPDFYGDFVNVCIPLWPVHTPK